MPRLNIIKGDKVASNADYRDALPENMIAVQKDILGANGYMISHPGLSLFAIGEGIDRGGFWNERFNKHFRVSHQSLIEVKQDGTTDFLGTISGDRRVSMADSFNTQAVVADGKMWLYDNLTLNQVTDPNLGNPIDITWIDGYYFMTDGEYLFHTDLNDESSIDPLKFATAEFSPDKTLAVEKTSDNQVIVFGRYSIEYFRNSASDNFAFSRLQGKAQKIGVMGTQAETELDGRFFILGGAKEESPSVHMVQAGSSQSIATREIDKVIATYTESELVDAVLETRTEERDQFILVRLPDHTLLYNHTIAKSLGLASAWTIIKTPVQDKGYPFKNRWRGANGVFDPRVAKWIYGDIVNSNIGMLDNTIASQYGEQVEAILYTPFLNIESASIDDFELDTVPGHNINIDNVTVSISLTYDGITYSKEWFKLYGMKADYNTRFILRRLGYVRDYVGFKIRCVSTDRVNFAGLNLRYA